MRTQLQGRAAIGKTKVRPAYANNKTGICGISEVFIKHGPRFRPFFVVSPHRRRFGIDTLGREEAFRRAVKCRAEHEARAKGARL